MTNFDYFLKEKKFRSFAPIAVDAERSYQFDQQMTVLYCRKALECALKWMYSVDEDLQMPYKDTLSAMLHEMSFKDMVDGDLWKRLDFIRKCGNIAAHMNRKIKTEVVRLCLYNLYQFMDFLAYCYGTEYEEHPYDESLLDAPKKQAAPEPPLKKYKSIDLQKLIAENEALKAQLTKQREQQEPNYVPKPLDLSEFQTRKIYIDTMLLDAGWIEGVNWLNEVELEGMPNQSGIGYADYVLYDDQQKPLAVVEAKKTCKDVSAGRQQAELYANILEEQCGRRPVIFLTNGFETRINDGVYPERKVASVYSKRDLDQWFNLLEMRTSLDDIAYDNDIAGRHYQKEAVRAVCDAFSQNRRKALLVMATGSGKTRTAISLCKILMDKGWVKNILFLADRTALVAQAKRSFVNLLPSLSCTNLSEEKGNYSAHCVFSTYQTMIGMIDDAKDDEGKVFSCGHFDLVICDEAHRSIYNKYKDIFNYFDAPLVGMTATPKNEIDKNTYDIFELQHGDPTYGYELAEAVKEGYLVDYKHFDTKLKFMSEGIRYDDLPPEEKEQYEEMFLDEEGQLPSCIDAEKMNSVIFNEDTIRKVLNILMTQGLKVDYGEKIGKTIIFAKNHSHAEKILEVFHKEYPYLGPDFAKVIDNHINYAQSAIDEFSQREKMPQIAISVDMLDTGIDVPEILNLVFFKKVMSKSKFWQMIGRGTRLCPGLIDGEDKKIFYIFDFCGNFDFFGMKSEGESAAKVTTLQEAVFNLQFRLIFALQKPQYQNAELQAYRAELVKAVSKKVDALDRGNFQVRQHLKYVERFADRNSYQNLIADDIRQAKEEVAPLIYPDQDLPKIVRFDALLYTMELQRLEGSVTARPAKDLKRRLRSLSRVEHIPAVKKKSELIHKVLDEDYLENAGTKELEFLRTQLRDLMVYLENTPQTKYETDFRDSVIATEEHGSNLESSDLQTYREKAEYYVRTHANEEAISKLHNNQPLTETDVKQLEDVLWNELGTREDYEREYGNESLGEFVRSIVGLDRKAAMEAFSAYLDETTMDSRQIYFVKEIVNYIVENGMMKDLRVLRETPFTDRGSVDEIFTDLHVWAGIRKVIEQINANAA